MTIDKLNSSTSSSKPGPLQAAAAILSPLLILAAAVAWLGQPPEVALSASAARIEDALAAHSPAVVVVGNSLAHSDIDPAQLAAALGLPAEEVYVLYSPGSRAPWWYAALKNRVYGSGHRPALVLVVNTMASLLSTRPASPRTWQLLSEQLTDHEPVLQAHLYGKEPGIAVWERMKRRRLTVRDRLLNSTRDAVVAALFDAAAEPALARVFDAEDAVDMALHSRVIPIVEEDSDAMDRQGEGSLLPELLELAQSNGAQVVFVRTPLTTLARSEDDLPADDEREAILALNRAGAGYIDLHDAGYPDTDFVDPRHMSRAGRERFTAQVAAALKELGALTDAPLPRAELPLSLRVQWSASRTGSPPRQELSVETPWGECGHRVLLPSWAQLSEAQLLAAGLGSATPLVVLEDDQPLRYTYGRTRDIGQSCDGTARFPTAALFLSPRQQPAGALAVTLTDAVPQRVDDLGDLYWVYPGTTLRIDIVEQSGERAPLTLTVRSLSEAPPQVALDGQPLSLQPQGSQRWQAAGVLSGGRGALTVRSGTDGPYALLTGLTLGQGDEATPLEAEGRPQPPRISLLTETIQHPQVTPTLALGPVVPVEGRGVSVPLYAIDMPELAGISNTGVLEVIPIRRASPLMLLEDGQPVPRPAPRPVPKDETVLWPSPAWWSARCAWVSEDDGTRFCHAGEHVLLLTADRSAPDPARLALQLDPERAFGAHGWWLYPGDRMVASTARLPLAATRHGANTVHIRGAALQPDDTSPVVLKLRVGGDIIWRTKIEARQLNTGALQWTLPEVITPPMREVRLIVESQPTGGYIAITEAALQMRLHAGD